MVLNMLEPSWFPVTLAVPCLAIAVPGSFVPAPLTMVGIAVLVFVLGSEITAAVFLSTTVSFLTVCGTGCIQTIMIRMSQRKAKLAEQAKEEARFKAHLTGNDEYPDSLQGLSEHEYREYSESVQSKANEGGNDE